MIIRSIRVIRVLMLKSLATVKKFKRKVLRKETQRESAIISSIRVIRVQMLRSLATVKKFKRKVRKVIRKEKPRKSAIISSIRVIRVLKLNTKTIPPQPQIENHIVFYKSHPDELIILDACLVPQFDLCP